MDLSDSFLCEPDPTDPGLKGKHVDPEVIIPLQPTVPPEDEGLCLSVDKENLIKAQIDRSLSASGFTHGVVCQIVLHDTFPRASSELSP